MRAAASLFSLSIVRVSPVTIARRPWSRAPPGGRLSRTSKHARAKQRASMNHLAGNHEHAIAGIMQGFGMLRRAGDMRLHHLEDEEIVPVDQRIVVQAAFEIGGTLADQGGTHLLSRIGAEA